MSETPIKDAILSETQVAHLNGWVVGRNSMKTDVLKILWSLPKTKATAEAIERISQLRIHIEGEKKS